MKRMFILIFVAVLLFSLAACGNNEGTFSDQTINNHSPKVWIIVRYSKYTRIFS